MIDTKINNLIAPDDAIHFGDISNKNLMIIYIFIGVTKKLDNYHGALRYILLLQKY